MKKRLILPLLSLFPILSFAAEKTLSDHIDYFFQEYTTWFVNFVFYEISFTENFKAPWVVLLLIGAGVYFTFYFRLVNFTGFKLSFKVIKGEYDNVEGVVPSDETDNPDYPKPKKPAHGEVTHFQALATALSATVGLGNIAGVAIAISIGGPGATFWMILGGLLGMATKFVECTLGVKYRDIGPDGTVYGGPMYYLQKGLAEKGMKHFGRLMAVIFAVLVTCGAFGIGNMFQANQASIQFANLMGWESSTALLGIGAVLAIVVGLVIVGGIKRIAKVTSRLVPIMAVVYIVSALTIIGVHYHYIGDAFRAIIDGAFSPTGITGGVVGVLIQGIRRSAFSNEAGLGSSPTAHAAVKTKYPASEGYVALMEPFIDTVLICTMTALIIIITNFQTPIVTYGQEVTEGVKLTAAAFEATFPNFSIALTAAVILFAVSTMISWSYYGLQGWMYLFGRTKTMRLTYNVVFCVMIWLGSAISLDAVIDFSDAMNFGMAIPNIIGILILAPVVRNEVIKYKRAIKEKKAKDS